MLPTFFIIGAAISLYCTIKYGVSSDITPTPDTDANVTLVERNDTSDLKSAENMEQNNGTTFQKKDHIPVSYWDSVLYFVFRFFQFRNQKTEEQTNTPVFVKVVIEKDDKDVQEVVFPDDEERENTFNTGVSTEITTMDFSRVEIKEEEENLIFPKEKNQIISSEFSDEIKDVTIIDFPKEKNEEISSEFSDEVKQEPNSNFTADFPKEVNDEIKPNFPKEKNELISSDIIAEVTAPFTEENKEEVKVTPISTYENKKELLKDNNSKLSANVNMAEAIELEKTIAKLLGQRIIVGKTKLSPKQIFQQNITLIVGQLTNSTCKKERRNGQYTIFGLTESSYCSLLLRKKRSLKDSKLSDEIKLREETAFFISSILYSDYKRYKNIMRHYTLFYGKEDPQLESFNEELMKLRTDHYFTLARVKKDGMSGEEFFDFVRREHRDFHAEYNQKAAIFIEGRIVPSDDE